MTDDKVYYPETIDENPLPLEGEVVGFGETQKTSNDEFQEKKIETQPIPTRRIAYEVIGNQLNTRTRKILAEFEFTESGAIQVGKYENGVSGDLRITPNGITARDEAGLITFAIDGTTGNAVFKGEVQAGTIITGLVVVGDNSVIIDGDAKRIVINDGTNDRVLIGYQKDGF